jgi:integrase/recombinase XerD
MNFRAAESSLTTQLLTLLGVVSKQFHFQEEPMLRSLLPKAYRRYLSLPLLGSIADGLDDWLASNGYTQLSRARAIRELPYVDVELRRRRIKAIPNLTPAVLEDYWGNLLQKYRNRAATVRALERYLAGNGQIGHGRPSTATSTTSILIEQYAGFLREVRGLATPTISRRRRTAWCFLQHLDEEGIRLKTVQTTQVESYISKASKRLSRATLQNEISKLRGFLRFLATEGRASEGLASQIDRPRVYRLEKLPRSLPWETVRALLRSIDQTSAKGLRDYAMFLLLATYGLRSSEVVAISLDDIRWRQGRLRIHQSKTSSSLELPLTNEVSCALVKHLKRTPPPFPYRRIFLRMRAPIGVWKPNAVNDALLSLVQKTSLRLPFQNPHSLRHALAIHLLKKGTPLKTIGDILGHRSPASTSTYLRLATEDLREVPLPIPGKERQAKEGRQ